LILMSTPGEEYFAALEMRLINTWRSSLGSETMRLGCSPRIYGVFYPPDVLLALRLLLALFVELNELYGAEHRTERGFKLVAGHTQEAALEFIKLAFFAECSLEFTFALAEGCRSFLYFSLKLGVQLFYPVFCPFEIRQVVQDTSVDCLVVELNLAHREAQRKFFPVFPTAGYLPADANYPWLIGLVVAVQVAIVVLLVVVAHQHVYFLAP